MSNCLSLEAAAVGIGALMAASALSAAAPLPIAVTGWNKDVVVENNPTYFANTFSNPSALNSISWVEQNASDGTNSVGSNGLPAETLGQTVNWTSGIVNTITGGNTTFQFQPYGTATGGQSPNILALDAGAVGSGGHGSLTLTSAAAYSDLAVLASTASGSTSTTTPSGSLTIGFTNGYTLAEQFWATNWTTSTAEAANSPYYYAHFNSATNGGQTQAWTRSNGAATSPQLFLFETDINLAGVMVNGADGTLDASTLPISYIAFTGDGTKGGNTETGIFALSGTLAVPEPSVVVVGLGALAATLRRRRRLA